MVNESIKESPGAFLRSKRFFSFVVSPMPCHYTFIAEEAAVNNKLTNILNQRESEITVWKQHKKKAILVALHQKIWQKGFLNPDYIKASSPTWEI